MAWSDYWNALSGGQRWGLCVGALLIVVVAVTLTTWIFHDPYVALATRLDAERVGDITRQLDTAKIAYRVDGAGDAVAVPRSELGKATAAIAAGPYALPPSVGLELFEQSDFSATDFAQRVNYQRALQGELTRTIQMLAGVRNARVHVILPDGGVLKRNPVKATAAVSLTLQPAATLSRAEILGIQRLVAASVPQIDAGDVVVLDESGRSLTQAQADTESATSSAQLELKRQVDQYLENKLLRLLQQLLPGGGASLSVDSTLDERRLQVTTEEPLAARSGKDATRVAGVLVRERQSQRGNGAGFTHTDGYADATDNQDWEYEYKVGNRVEQVLSAPGSIKRISVAVALRGAPAELSPEAVEELVTRAVGVDRSRGDAVAVLMLPALADPLLNMPSTTTEQPTVAPEAARVAPEYTQAWMLAAIVLVPLSIVLAWWLGRRRTTSATVDNEAVLAKVKQWLHEGADRGRT